MHISALEYLHLYRSLHKVPQQQLQELLLDWRDCETFTRAINQRLDQCSAEIIQTARLACALMKKPRILLLDEPTRHLDSKTKGFCMPWLKN